MEDEQASFMTGGRQRFYDDYEPEAPKPEATDAEVEEHLDEAEEEANLD